MKMKHLSNLSKPQDAPAAALSIIELDGLAQMISRLLATLTSGVAFWNLIALPPNEVNNDHKGI